MPFQPASNFAIRDLSSFTLTEPFFLPFLSLRTSARRPIPLKHGLEEALSWRPSPTCWRFGARCGDEGEGEEAQHLFCGVCLSTARLCAAAIATLLSGKRGLSLTGGAAAASKHVGVERCTITGA